MVKQIKLRKDEPPVMPWIAHEQSSTPGFDAGCDCLIWATDEDNAIDIWAEGLLGVAPGEKDSDTWTRAEGCHDDGCTRLVLDEIREIPVEDALVLSKYIAVWGRRP